MQIFKVLLCIIFTLVLEDYFKAYLAFVILEPLNGVFLQSVKAKMKCCIMGHFIRVYTVCKGKKDLQTKKYNIF